MARIARVVVPNYAHHVTHRGVHSLSIFRQDQDRKMYLEFMARETKPFGIEIFAWCLMTNHVHLIAGPEGERGLVLGCKNWRHIHGWKFGPTFAHFPLSFPVAREPGTVSAGSIGGKNLAKRFSFVSLKGGGELLPAPSMKEAMPHDAQRSVPGSRTHEPIECYAKFGKLVLVSSVALAGNFAKEGFL